MLNSKLLASTKDLGGGGWSEGFFFQTLLLFSLLICTYFNFLVFKFYIFSKLRVGKEIKSALSKVDHLHSEIGHARIVILVSFNNSFHYKQGQKKLLPM